MAEISKTPKKGLSLPEHYDPSVDKLRENMTLIDSLLQQANPNDLSSINDGESNINTLTTTGRYLVKSNATGYPISGYAGVVDVFRAGVYILQEWRSINAYNLEYLQYRRYSTNSGSSWNSWIKDWNASNDGSGSGLDADTLDGIQGEGYSKYTKVNQSSSSSKEINNLVTNGLHFVEIASTKVTGSPTGAAGKFSVVVVMNGTTYVTQTATDLSDGKVYIRCRNGSTTWGSWSELTPLIPVLTADPSSPSNGQLWIRSDL